MGTQDGQPVFEEFQDSDIWNRILNIQGSILLSVAGTSSVASGTTTRTVVGRQAITTDSVTALEILGLGWYINVYPSTIAGASATQANKWQVDFTYDQPYPPAASSTTPASTTGNLGFRNIFALIHGMDVSIEPATQTGLYTRGCPQGWKLFSKPIRIVGTNMEVGITPFANSLGVEYDVGAYFIGRYVGIGASEYVNLVALATGQAVLPPSILGGSE